MKKTTKLLRTATTGMQSLAAVETSTGAAVVVRSATMNAVRSLGLRSSRGQVAALTTTYSKFRTVNMRLVRPAFGPLYSTRLFRHSALGNQQPAFSIQHSAVTDHLPDRSSPCCSLNRYRATVKLPLTVFHKDSLSLDHGRDEMLAFHGHCP